MGQKRTYKHYSKDYKEEAVALQGYTVPEAAKSLGLASNMLYRWKEQIESQLEGKYSGSAISLPLSISQINPSSKFRIFCAHLFLFTRQSGQVLH